MNGSPDPTRADDRRHLVPLSGGWSVWRTVCLRSAGFPIAALEQLGSPLAARAVDGLLGAAKETAELRRAADEACATELVRIARCVRATAGEPRFREAVTWQNRAAAANGLDAVLRAPAGASDRKTRRRELVVASYLQRYCAKNDTIGFFGPLGWAELATDGPVLEMRAGAELIARRTTYFEHWAIDELARALAADPELRPFLVPRRHPTVRLDDTALWDARLRRSELPAAFARVLAACDGARPAHQIAAELAADEELDLDGTGEVYDLLTQLVDKNVVFWTLEVPTIPPYPERTLERALAAADGPGAARARAALAELDGERQHVSAAAGDPALLDRALADLEERFQDLTGQAAARRPGAVYAGRRLVYEDCTRAVHVRLGREFVECLGPPLELVLQSARWYSWSIARRYLVALRAAHAELRGRLDSATVEYLRLWDVIAPLFPNTSRPAALVGEVALELQRRWATLLAFEPGERRATRSVDELRAGAQDAFAAPAPGWPWARYHCPDVLVAAAGPAAAARGDFTLVLGELHSAAHSYLMPAWVELAPDPHEVLRGYQADIATTCVFPVTSRLQSTHVDHASQVQRDLDLEIGDTRSHRDRSQVLPVAELVSEEVDGRLIIRTRDGRHALDAMAFLGYYLTAECTAQFRLLPDAAHSPRVTVDRLVLARERWVFDPSTMGFCHMESARADRFIAARRWVLTHSLPRFVFMKIPEEPKPMYMDLESPLYIELMAREVRKASSVSISEMLPGPDECWLEDAQGNRYASELRIAAVDPIPWTPAPAHRVDQGDAPTR